MYRINRAFNAFFVILLQIAYAYLGYKINLEYKYSNIMEFCVGIIVTTILMNILDHIFLFIAYETTRRFSRTCGYSSAERKGVHWIIRVALYLIVYIISITPLCSMILTPTVQYFTREFTEWYTQATTDFSNALLKSVTK